MKAPIILFGLVAATDEWRSCLTGGDEPLVGDDAIAVARDPGELTMCLDGEGASQLLVTVYYAGVERALGMARQMFPELAIAVVHAESGDLPDGLGSVVDYVIANGYDVRPCLSLYNAAFQFLQGCPSVSAKEASAWLQCRAAVRAAEQAAEQAAR